MDEACLRFHGFSHDHEIQQELLSALELEDSLNPQHARPLIRNLFAQVRDHSTELANRVRKGADQPSASFAKAVHSLRHSLAALIQALQARHHETH